MVLYDSMWEVTEGLIGSLAPFLGGTPEPSLSSSREIADVVQPNVLQVAEEALLAKLTPITTTSQEGQTRLPESPVVKKKIKQSLKQQRRILNPEEEEVDETSRRFQVEARHYPELGRPKDNNNPVKSKAIDFLRKVFSETPEGGEAEKALGVQASSELDTGVSTGTQCEGGGEDSVEEDPDLWKKEFLRQRLFIHRLCQALLANRIRVGVEYAPSPLPGIKHQFLNVSSIEMSAPYDDDEGLKHKLVDVSSSDAEQINDERPGCNDATAEALVVEDRKGEFSQKDLETLVNDPQAQEVLRDVLIMELSRHGITVDAQFNNNEVILRLTGVSNGPVHDSSYLNRVQQLLWERTSSFGQDLRGKWGQVQQLLVEKATWFGEPYPFTGNSFDIVQNISNKTCTAILPGPEEQLLRDVRQILYASGIFTHINEARTNLAFEGVVNDIDCLSIAIRCALLYKKAVLKLDRALRDAYILTTLSNSNSNSETPLPPFSRQHRNRWTRKEPSDEQRFYEAFHTTLREYRNIIERRVEAISRLLAEYEEKKTTTTTTTVAAACLKEKTTGTLSLSSKALLSTALKNAIAAREATNFGTALTASMPAPPHGSNGSHAEKRLRRREAAREGLVEELLHEVVLKEVQRWEWRAKHERLRAEVVGVQKSEAELRRSVAFLQVHHAASKGKTEDLGFDLECARVRAEDLETQLRARDAEVQVLQTDLLTTVHTLRGLVREREAEVHNLQAQLGDSKHHIRDDVRGPLPNGGIATTIRVFETYPDGVSVVSGVDAEGFSTALCTLLERRLAQPPQEHKNENENENEDGMVVQMVGEDLKSQRDAESILIQRTREVAKLRAELGEARRNNEALDQKLEYHQQEHARHGAAMTKMWRDNEALHRELDHDERACATRVSELKDMVLEAQEALAHEKDSSARLEQELEDLANLRNALEVQLMDHLQVTEIQRDERTPDGRPRSSSVVRERLRRNIDGPPPPDATSRDGMGAYALCAVNRRGWTWGPLGTGTGTGTGTSGWISGPEPEPGSEREERKKPPPPPPTPSEAAGAGSSISISAAAAVQQLCEYDDEYEGYRDDDEEEEEEEDFESTAGTEYLSVQSEPRAEEEEDDDDDEEEEEEEEEEGEEEKSSSVCGEALQRLPSLIGEDGGLVMASRALSVSPESFTHVEEYECDADSLGGDSSVFDDLEGAESVYSLSSEERSGEEGSDEDEL